MRDTSLRGETGWWRLIPFQRPEVVTSRGPPAVSAPSVRTSLIRRICGSNVSSCGMSSRLLLSFPLWTSLSCHIISGGFDQIPPWWRRRRNVRRFDTYLVTDRSRGMSVFVSVAAWTVGAANAENEGSNTSAFKTHCSCFEPRLCESSIAAQRKCKAVGIELITGCAAIHPSCI